MSTETITTDTDIIVIGSGIGGLSAAALLGYYGFRVVVCESHNIAGGAAHGFERDGYQFDSGPSLYSGLSAPSPNPLRQVLDVIGVELPCVNYDTWGCFVPEGYFPASVGAEQFCQVLRDLRGETAVEEWQNLQAMMAPFSQASVAIPPAALRWDLGAIRTIMPFLGNLAKNAVNVGKLTGAFAPLLRGVVQDEFIYNWLNLLCFLLSGLPATDTSAAEVAFMFADWYKPGVQLDYPLGGSAALVDALVTGLRKQGGELYLNAHVEQILVKNKRASGVKLRNGMEINAKKAVISNASIWDTLKLIPDGAISPQYRRQREATPECDSFMHLHLGIDAQGLATDLACHYIFVEDWNLGITTPQNVVVISIPSTLDPSLAPPGKHVIHAYTPGNEPYRLWSGMKRHTPAYQQQKQARSEVMWKAIAKIIPDIQERTEVSLVGTPLTHARFLRRHRGSYGPAISARTGLFPTGKTPLRGLLCCGDSTFPGIGLPAVAASGMITANTLASVNDHLQMLREIELI